jgi:hypothetical protein
MTIVMWSGSRIVEQFSLNPEVDTRLKDYPMYFEPLALWKFNFAEAGFPKRKPLKAWALIFQLRISGLVARKPVHGDWALAQRDKAEGARITSLLSQK